jgi:small-conductance mechanosensitive channel
VHRRMGKQVSGTTRLCDPIRERANYVFGKRSARLLKVFITGRLPSKSDGAAYRRLHRRLLRPVFSNVVINNVTATTTSANERYVRSTVVCLFIMFCEYMFSCYLFLFILLFSISSIFELHVVVASVVMFNILKLIMEIVPNYPTHRKILRL